MYSLTFVDRHGRQFSNKSHFDDRKHKSQFDDHKKNPNIRFSTELYEFLQSYEGRDIYPWLKIRWEGKDKQESLFRLLTGLGLIVKLSEFDICKGNYNIGSITKHTTKRDVFYNDENDLIKVKDTGDKSDLTMLCKENNKKILVASSKNRENAKNEGIGKYDIRDIHSLYVSKYENYDELVYCICTRNTKRLIDTIQNCRTCNEDIKSKLQRPSTVFVDWKDLNEAFHRFKDIYGQKSWRDIINSNKATLILKMHQHLGVFKTLRMKNSEKKKILWGHVPRSGKSYIIAGCIDRYSEDKAECNYLVITTAINETNRQYHDVFNHLQFEGFNVRTLKKETEKEVKKVIKTSKKNIIIISDMYIKNTTSKNTEHYDDSRIKIKKIQWLRELNFEFVFLDESHKGGTTPLAQEMMNYYGHKATEIYITATYSKPINDYNIPKNCWILWDLEDIKLCKNISDKNSINRLVEKHDACIKGIITTYSKANIISEYSKYPNLYVLSDELTKDARIKALERNNLKGHNHDGDSLEGRFLLVEQKYIVKDKESYKTPTFQNEERVLDIFYRIFGKKKETDIGPVIDAAYPEKNIFINRIKLICDNPETHSRFIGRGDFEKEPMIIMAFLPQKNIDKISTAVINLLEKNNVIPDYHIISINSIQTSNPKKSIEDARIIARNSEKKGVLVLSGRQCSLGVSIHNCDIVLLLNNSMKYDMIYQMMFRCMTEGKNKKCGFVVDLNIHRVIETSVNYASLIKPDIHPREAVKFILTERLITLNGDHWMSSFGNNEEKMIDTFCADVYEMYSSNTENALKHLLNRIRYRKYLLTEEEKETTDKFETGKCKNKHGKKKVDEGEQIKKGIEKIKVDPGDITDTLSETSDKTENETKINYMDIFVHIVPLMCLITIYFSETSIVNMFGIIEKDEKLEILLITQTMRWWGKNIDIETLKDLINIYIKHMADDKEIAQIIRTVKELFIKNIDNQKTLGELIDKYFIPQESERKNDAEVSTPSALRKNMLDTVPIEVWSSICRVCDPCCGKGGILVDIIDRFMLGLREKIPDKEKRYKTIVENCIYFIDINPTNIFICKLLINRNKKYELNYHEGNTLDLDIKKEWDIDSFDAVIGNPPYSTNPSKQNTTPLYNLFTEKFIDKTKYLLYVMPSRWFVGGKGLDKFRNMMKNRKDIRFIYSEDNAKKWFGNDVEIKGGVNYFLKDENYNGKCLFDGVLYDLSKYDIIVKPRHHNIIEKIKKKKCLDSLYNSSGYFKVRTNDKRLNDIGATKCYVSSLKSKKRYKFIDNYENTNNFWKVITPRAAFGAYSGFGYKQISNPNEIYTDSYISFRVDNESQARSLLSYLNTTFVNYLLSVRKISQDISKNTCKWIALVPLNKIWSNEEVYDYFKLTEGEIKFIESSI